jgi:hypothetical protein
MKFTPLIAAASVAIAAIASAPAPAQTRTVVTVGAPAGPGWVTYREHTYSHDWDGPRYYDADGPHHGWYNYNNNYYQNCSYRHGRHHHRDWQCW